MPEQARSTRRFGLGFRLWPWLMAMGLSANVELRGEAESGSESPATLLVVVGAPGEEEFGKQFQLWADMWRTNAGQAEVPSRFIGVDDAQEISDKQRLRDFLREAEGEGTAPLWIVLLGHGTFDGKQAKFNMRGPDVSAEEMLAWLEPVSRPVALIDCTSSSAPFLTTISSTNRVVVTATRSGFEQNFARFGLYFAEAIADPESDLDKDGQTSLLEAYLVASRRVEAFYESEGRLSTEHALLDDTGDGKGTPADWFRGVRVVKKTKEDVQPDGLRAHQFHLIRSDLEKAMPPELRQRRDRLEMTLFQLRESKPNYSEEEYYEKLEAMLLELAEIYALAETRQEMEKATESSEQKAQTPDF